MSVNSKMTAIADKIRALLGVSGTMDLDAMATNLETERTNISNAFTVVGNKGGTVPSSKVSGALADSIASIPAGVSVQKKTGSFTTDTNGAATVNCGFKPDAVFFTGGIPQDSNKYCNAGVAFYEANQTSIVTFFAGHSTSYYFSKVTVNQTSTGFTVSSKRYDLSVSSSTDRNRSFSYIAIKYT